MTGSVPTYGTVGKPYPEQPYYSRTREVHWSGTFGVLTVTVLGSMTMRGGRPDYSYNSSHDLSSGAGVLVGPYGVGDPITWLPNSMATVLFTDDSFFVETLGDGGDGAVLGAARFSYLIDFAELAREQATNPAFPFQHGEVAIRQGWSTENVPALETGYDYNNQYRLQLYASAGNFVGGPDQTVTVKKAGTPPVPVALPTYDVTKLIAWNDGPPVPSGGAGEAHYILHLGKTGWLSTPLPSGLTSASSLLSGAIA